jgi:hypothetical protein
MSFVFRLLAFGLLITASIPYFRYYRDVQDSGADHQQYFVIDSGVCEHSRSDFGDLRLYAGQNEVPYALSIERGSSQSERKNVQVLQPGTVSGKTELFLDMSGLSEYDRIELQLKARDFVSKVRIDGQDDLHGSHWATLANTIVYDLSDDHLGNNTTLRLPLTTYRYLRISMEGPVKPADVQGATAEIREEEKEVWGTISSQPQQEQKGKDTIFMFSVPKNVSVERLVFTIDPAQPNFKREVELQGENDVPLAEGEISRVHMVRHGQKIDSEQTEIDTAGISSTVLKVIVHNGDDRPLKIDGVQLQQYERRIYFNSSSAPHLYYGDEKLQAPEYDYAKLFQKDPQATRAQLGPEQMNVAYTGRPDDRPWSERHPAVLWVAIIAAVAILGGLALRSMKTVAGNSAS